MTGVAVTRALGRLVEANASAIVTTAHRHTGCTLNFEKLDATTVTMSAPDPARLAQLLRRDALVTVTFRDGFRCGCFLAHITRIDGVTVALTRPKQIVARDQRRAVRAPIAASRRLWVLLSHSNGRLRGLTRDVSQHGLGLQLEEGPPMPPVDTEVEVQLQLLSGRLTVTGTVVNVNGRRCGVRLNDLHAGEVDVDQLVSMQFLEWSESAMSAAAAATP
ncbi:MAG: PilZ domain-containing protein [Myxococcota bacterium]